MAGERPKAHSMERTNFSRVNLLRTCGPCSEIDYSQRRRILRVVSWSLPEVYQFFNFSCFFERKEFESVRERRDSAARIFELTKFERTKNAPTGRHQTGSSHNSLLYFVHCLELRRNTDGCIPRGQYLFTFINFRVRWCHRHGFRWLPLLPHSRVTAY